MLLFIFVLIIPLYETFPHFEETKIGKFLEPFWIISYLLYTVIGAPFLGLLKFFGLANNGGGGVLIFAMPEISLTGMLFISLFYSVCFYTVYSLFQKRYE